MGIIGRFGDADAPWTILGIHADWSSSRGCRKIGIKGLHPVLLLMKESSLRRGCGSNGVVDTERVGFDTMGMRTEATNFVWTDRLR